jgi:hypothetical protein
VCSKRPNAFSDLEAALDALHQTYTPLCQGFRLLSSSQRRRGGQGVVQFASIEPTTGTVRLLPTFLLFTCLQTEEMPV